MSIVIFNSIGCGTNNEIHIFFNLELTKYENALICMLITYCIIPHSMDEETELQSTTFIHLQTSRDTATSKELGKD